MSRPVFSHNAPAAIGPYSQAIISGNLLFVSGQLGFDPKTGELPAGFENQVRNIMPNLLAILEEAGCTFDNVVKTTIFVTNLANFPVLNEIYGSYFPNHKPARSCVEVSALPKGGLVEIELIAELS